MQAFPLGRGRTLPAVLAGLVVAALLGWLLLRPPAAPEGAAATPAPVPGLASRQAPPPGPGAAASASDLPVAAANPGPPLTEAERGLRRAQWQERLARARDALAAYEQAARYPHESRPISEHPDQVRPFDPVEEEHPLRMPGGGSIAAGVRLKTTQERTFLSGNEASRVTLTLLDAQGRALPLQVTRAVLHEVTPPGRTATTVESPMPVNDRGTAGDAVAGDGTWSVTVQPATQGYSRYAGLVRLDLYLEHAGQPGFLYFDFIYSPETAARWLPGVREALEQGSLVFRLPLEVLIGGRYVVSARVDDARGRPFALALFNGELAAGTREVPLPVFGKLVHDEQPAFPLQLRDVDAFLLKPDTYPDRVMLQRLAGVVHTSRTYPVADFSPAAWTSEERDRHLAEFGRDVRNAERELQRLGP